MVVVGPPAATAAPPPRMSTRCSAALLASNAREGGGEGGAATTGLPRRDLYQRALALKGRRWRGRVSRPTRARRAARKATAAAPRRVAAWFLRLKFYRVLARRYRTPLGEIDLIVKRGRTIAFVEVKRAAERGARRSNR